MKRFSPIQLETFLTEVDDALTDRAVITVIGGGALALAYGVQAFTNDLDTYDTNLEALADAIAAAHVRTGLDIPVANATIAQLPPGFDRRLKRVMPHLRKLQVWVADPSDLAASKLCAAISTTGSS